MRRACALYCNSISPFRPFLKLMLDIELNPGPNGSLKYSRVVQYTRTVTVRISYVSIRTDRTHQQQGYTFGKVCFTVRKSHLISGTQNISWQELSIRTDRTDRQQGYIRSVKCVLQFVSRISLVGLRIFHGKSCYIRFVDPCGSNGSTTGVYGL